uniref:Uncharacterized protein n=1 Tax=Arundo donax TaxID=35708 RepID=A0A0A9CHS7_ARUDO
MFQIMFQLSDLLKPEYQYKFALLL